MTLLANSINALLAKVNRVFLNLAHFSSSYRFPELNEILNHFGLKMTTHSFSWLLSLRSRPNHGFDDWLLCFSELLTPLKWPFPLTSSGLSRFVQEVPCRTSESAGIFDSRIGCKILASKDR